MLRIALSLAFSLASLVAVAEKTMYIPQEWRNRTDTLIWAETDTENKYTWSLSRSYETDNVIILWDKGYGSVSPSNAESSFKVDIEDLAAKAEAFYELECNELGFVDPETSNIAKYKMMILLNHTTTWTCYGGGYDYQVPALWLSPNTCWPVGSAVAHEVGHSFHYMCYCEDSNYGTTSGVQTGFHSALGNGQTIWETTANWQALQSYPDEVFTESYHYAVYNYSHPYAFSHEWHRYQAYMFMYYLCDYYQDIRTVADVWNQHETSVVDFNQALMDLKGLSASELYKLHFDYALRAVTWDLDAWAPYRTSAYVGNYKYYCVQDGTASYQVAYASAPQATGFNVIPLAVPTAGDTVSIDFTALTSGADLAFGDPGLYLDGNTTLSECGKTTYNSTTAMRNFRLGYVALLSDGTREYFAVDSLYCHGKTKKTETVSMVVPEKTQNLWFVVAPAPGTYVVHKWDENIKNDDQWPYAFEIHGTDLLSSSNVTVYQGYMIGDRGIADVTLEYTLSALSSSTDATSTLTIDDDGLAYLGTALQMKGSAIAGLMVDYNEEGPQPGQIMSYAYNSSGDLLEYPSADGDGTHSYWFTKRGAFTADASSGAIKATFNPSTLTIDVLQVGGALSSGTTVPARIALKYVNAEGDTAVAHFLVKFAVKTTAGQSACTVTYDEDYALPVESTIAEATDDAYYTLQGQRLSTAPSRPGIYLHQGRKIVVK